MVSPALVCQSLTSWSYSPIGRRPTMMSRTAFLSIVNGEKETPSYESVDAAAGPDSAPPIVGDVVGALPSDQRRSVAPRS